jgi:putative spermidine/putrescine transport system ATP-binding protein
MTPGSEAPKVLDRRTRSEPSAVGHPLRDGVHSRPAVELRDLRKAFGSAWAVSGMSLAVAPGEFLTMLGPSGSGKTTTLRLVAGFTTPTSGAVLVDGEDVTGLPAHRRNIGMVFQSYALFPHMTAGANVGFPLEMRRMPRAQVRGRIEEMFSLVGLRGLEGRYPAQLSGGQQQRVALARALVFGPRLLLMDEPLGALDKNLRQGLQSEVRQLQQRLGITVLYVTHDQDEALAMSDRIAVVREGRLVQVGTGEDLYDRPRSLFVARFIGESNVFRGRLQRVGQGMVLSSNGWSLPAPAMRRWASPAKQGEAVALLVRPEKIGFGPVGAGSPAPSDGLANITARAGAAIRLGAVWRFEFELPDGQRVNATLPIGAEGGPLRPGDEVTIHWRVDDSIVLPVEEEEGE